MNIWDKWEDLGQELKKRTTEPIYHPSFVCFFISAVLVIGGSGFWIELVNYLLGEPGSSLGSVRTSIMTFFPVLAATTCLQVIWDERFKSLRNFITTVFVLLLMAIYACSNSKISDKTALTFGLIASVVSLWMWWVTNYNQEYLQDPVNPNAPLGKNPGEGLSGNLNSFITE